jgi:hypothetical protein
MTAFDYRQAEEIRDVFLKHRVRYLFIGKSGAILLGFPDTTQDADLFVERSPQNGQAPVVGLCELGFRLTDSQTTEILSGKDFAPQAALPVVAYGFTTTRAEGAAAEITQARKPGAGNLIHYGFQACLIRSAKAERGCCCQGRTRLHNRTTLKPVAAASCC